MKELSSGPRKWAFVVIAGGTVFSLPFVQINSSEADSEVARLDIVVPIPDKPTIAEPPPLSQIVRAQDVIPSLSADLTSSSNGLVVDPHHQDQASHQANRANENGGVTAQEPIAQEFVQSLPRDARSNEALPEWVHRTKSPKDQTLPEFPAYQQAETIPMQPLRPWIEAPGANSPADQTNGQATGVFPANNRTLDSHSKSKTVPGTALSPWQSESQMSEEGLPATAGAESSALASHSAPIDTWPDERLTPEQRARFIKKEKPRELASAIVPPDQVLVPASPIQPNQTVSVQSRPVLSRGPGVPPVGAQVKFGQPAGAPPLPTPSLSVGASLPGLPESRKTHVIFQPR